VFFRAKEVLVNSHDTTMKAADSKPNLRTVTNDPVPAEDPPDTYLVNSQGQAERAPTNPENRRFARPGGYLLYLGVAVGILVAVALIGII
jgi:hypothetical protein